jgi:hypothetical protein
MILFRAQTKAGYYVRGMTQKGSGEGAKDLGTAVQSLIVSGIRLSAGLTLYGIGRLQRIVDAATGDEGLPLVAEKIDLTLHELSGSIESHMDETRKEALRSVSRVSAKAIEKVCGAFSENSVGAAGDRSPRRREVASRDAVPARTLLAVDVLTGPPGQ